MDDRNEIKKITMAELFPLVIEMKAKHWRLVQICAVSIEHGYEMSYSFCKNEEYRMVTLRLEIDAEETIASITQIYPCAFLQENEAAELFGVKIQNINPNYHDKLYRIDEVAPFKKKE
ncbi:NADH dehydrogenase subunit C [Clostridiales bacterium CHKCI001]|nr:NADH dehydrogenase subunit C [Clostridiales bacterium CHKCI001]